MSLPEQYNTVIGEQGSKLSGGQKQRISIVRCLLKDCPIMLLDEATSGLDHDNEMRFIEVLSRLSHQKTILLVHYI